MPVRRLLPAFLIVLASFNCFGQNITGSILGQVADPSGSAVPGAAVTVRNVETGATAQTTTDASGSYSIPNLLAGTLRNDRTQSQAFRRRPSPASSFCPRRLFGRT